MEKTIDISIKVTRARAIIFFIIGLGVTGVYHEATEDWKGTIKFGATFFAAVVAIYAVLQTADSIRNNTKQVRQSAQEQRVRFALEISGRWTERIRDLRPEWGSLMLKFRDMSPDARAEYLISDENMKQKGMVLDVLNYFEEAAVAVNLGVADEQTVRRHQESLALEYWTIFESWVTAYRDEKKSPSRYVEFETVVNRWKAARRS